MFRTSICRTPVPAACALLFAFAATARADSVELTNGDMLHGKVVSLDDKELRIDREQGGPMTVPRDKVLTIHLGDRGPVPDPKPPASEDDAVSPTRHDAQAAPAPPRNAARVSPAVLRGTPRHKADAPFDPARRLHSSFLERTASAPVGRIANPSAGRKRGHDTFRRGGP
ncbi:MAG: hypothetical protein WD069_14055 [Planctomycetales bacterium]